MTWLYVPYISALDTEASSLPSEESPAPFVTLSGTPTQRPLSWRGWQRRDWTKLLSGLTSPRLTVTRGVDAWISSLPVSPASPSPQQESGWDLTMTGGSGPTSNGSSVRYDPDTCSWKTCQALFEQDYPLSSIPLPSSGSMRNGVCTPRPTLEPRTAGNGSGLWGTPVARDDQKSPEAHMAMKARMDRNTATSLTVQAKMWPTPRASMNENRTTQDAPSHGKTHGRTLAGTASHHAPTTTTDGPSGMVLNPRFVEALMGLPNGWLTPSISAATASCPSAPVRRGCNSLGGLHD